MSAVWTLVAAHPLTLLATHDGVNGGGYPVVLMHLLVRGAFWPQRDADHHRWFGS